MTIKITKPIWAACIVGTPSDSVFCLVDEPPVEKQQVASDITAFLRETYWQGSNNELGKIYIIRATRKDIFEIRGWNRPKNP